MNKKFFILLTLTCLVGMSSCTMAFTDIEGHWAEKEIEEAESMKLINGYSGDVFKPDANMTRAELITVINRMLGIVSESDKYIPDVTRQDWFHSEVRKAMAMGIIQGDEEGYINPNSYVTREQAVLIMARAFGVQVNNNIYNFNFVDDNDISAWAKSEFLTFVKNQYISGYPDNSIKPKAYITRAEILTIINRIIEKDISNFVYNVKLDGNYLIREKNVKLKNVEIFGDLIVGESTNNNLGVENLIVHGNLILYSPIDFEKNSIDVNGNIIKVYENIVTSESYFVDKVYGFSFSLPTGASVYNFSNKSSIDYDKNDVIIIDIKQNDKYYFQTLEDISLEEIKLQAYDSIYKKVESGKLDNKYPYELYKDNAKSHLLVIKRDNIVYSLLFINVVSDNLLDNVVSNIQFIDGDKVINHDEKIYKNTKLCLKFTYKEGYVGVDDSYNTGVINSGDAFFKLFIQVNKITDIDEYSTKEVAILLRTLAENDGKILDETIKKVAYHDAIQFEIVSDDDKIISLYVIIGNNLYNFIFKGTAEQIDSIGNDMFLEIVNSMEF